MKMYACFVSICARGNEKRSNKVNNVHGRDRRVQQAAVSVFTVSPSACTVWSDSIYFSVFISLTVVRAKRVIENDRAFIDQ